MEKWSLALKLFLLFLAMGDELYCTRTNIGFGRRVLRLLRIIWGPGPGTPYKTDFLLFRTKHHKKIYVFNRANISTTQALWVNTDIELD